MSDLNNVPQRVSALSLAKVAADKKEFLSYLDRHANAKVEAKGGAAHVLVYMMGIYGEKLYEFPVPGTTQDKVTGNQPWDIYEAEGTKADGSVGVIKGSFYKDFFTDLPNGAKLANDQAALRLAAKGSKDTPAPFNKLSAPSAERELNKVNVKLNYALDMVRKAMAIFFKLEEIKEHEDKGVKIEMAWKLDEEENETEELQSTTLPFMLVKTKGPSDFKTLSVGGLLALNVERALAVFAEGKTSFFTALKDSGRRGTKKTTPTSTETPKIGMSNLGATVLEFANFLDDKENYGKLIAMVGNPKNVDILLSLAELQDALDGITSKFERKIADARIAEANGEGKEAA